MVMVVIVNLFIKICRRHLDLPSSPLLNFVQLQGLRLHSKKRGLAAVPKKINSENSAVEASNEDEVVVKKKTSRTPKRTQKKTIAETDASSEESIISASSEDTKKPRGRTRRKGSPPYCSFRSCYLKIYLVCAKPAI